jgi:hypothetical protein
MQIKSKFIDFLKKKDFSYTIDIDEDGCLLGGAPCSLIEVYQLIALMETASAYEVSVNFYQTTRSNNPESSHLRNRRRDNLKSH